MGRFTAYLINPTPVVLNLRAAAQKQGYSTGTSLAEGLGWSERKIRRMFSGSQDVKCHELQHLAKFFGISAYHFLKEHYLFLEYINLTMDGDPIRREIEPMLDTEKIRNYEMIFFMRKAGVLVLNDGKGYCTETILFSGTEDRTAEFFEELCLRYDDEIKVEIGILKCEGITFQEYCKEKMDLLRALENKVVEIWSQVNPDVAELWENDKFTVYNQSADRFLRILPNKEYELVHTLKNEIFPHKITGAHYEE